MLEKDSSPILKRTNLWDEALTIIEKKLNGQIFSAWFQRTKFISFTDGLLLLEVPSKFFRDWLKEHYLDLIIDTLFSICRSEEHTSELQSHSFISYAVFCLKKKITNTNTIATLEYRCFNFASFRTFEHVFFA